MILVKQVTWNVSLAKRGIFLQLHFKVNDIQSKKKKKCKNNSEIWVLLNKNELNPNLGSCHVISQAPVVPRYRSTYGLRDHPQSSGPLLDDQMD